MLNKETLVVAEDWLPPENALTERDVTKIKHRRQPGDQRNWKSFALTNKLSNRQAATQPFVVGGRYEGEDRAIVISSLRLLRRVKDVNRCIPGFVSIDGNQ